MRVTTLELTKPKLNINVTEGTNQTFHFSLLNSILFRYFLKFVFVCLKRGRGGGANKFYQWNKFAVFAKPPFDCDVNIVFRISTVYDRPK